MNYTIKQSHKDFPDDNACLNYIFNARFGSAKCPVCGKARFYRVKNRKCFNCSCGYQIHPVSGTIFHKSETKLTDWFFAIYLMSNSKNGVSAKELQRHLGCTYKTAWRIAKQIRSLMVQGNDMLKKIVETDETYIGGRTTNSRRNENKSMVVGMVQRGGMLKAKHIKEYWTPTILKNLADNIERGTRLITDDSTILRKSDRMGYLHDSINHSAKKYVKGDIYTNTIEGFWSQLKRSLDGTYHSISAKHLQSYVDEFAFHYNVRLLPVSAFETLLSRLCRPYSGGQRMPVFEGVRISS
jgi:hypothetical protein